MRTLGFPYGSTEVDNQRGIMIRGFSGEVVAGRRRFRPPGFEDPAFSVYELSFSAPRGLSGAPLLHKDEVVGIVIGNSDTSMLVHRSTETETVEAGERTKTTIEHYEKLTLGISVRSEEILRLESVLANGTIESHLRLHGLL